jgi:hypothetical protein
MRTLRTITVWLLMVVASGTTPLAASYAAISNDGSCGDVCKRCQCKQHSETGSFRAPCPCCQPPNGAAAITLLPPAVLPEDTPKLAPPPDATRDVGASAQPDLIDLSHLDPPPRPGLEF